MKIRRCRILNFVLDFDASFSPTQQIRRHDVAAMLPENLNFKIVFVFVFFLFFGGGVFGGFFSNTRVEVNLLSTSSLRTLTN